MRPTNRTTWILLLSFLGLIGLESPGCSNEVENIDRNGLNPAIKGECERADSDNDPCTLEGCKGQPNAHVITAGLKCGVGEALTCTPTGACGGCASPDQCGDSSFCLPWVCDVDKVCRQTPSPNGQKLQTQVPGDCKELQCDGAGGEKTVNVSDAPTYDCYMTTCSAGMEVKTPSPQGTTCNTGGGNSCDGKGKCIECNTDADCAPQGKICDSKSNLCFSCTDGMQNGDESDVNCGGDRCPACPQGKKCDTIQDCASNLSCADGICCDNACDQPCEACNLPASVGICNFIPKYEDDSNYGMNMSCLAANMKTCSGMGACRGALGAACTGPTGCASGKCDTVTKVCVKTTGDSCNQPTECFSGMCTAGKCT